ncbi:MAG: hypothetical protein PHQ35_11355 [Phycisphaerae bacterium]|nr:hypothetical protein [Phycisphaerae bacterium]
MIVENSPNPSVKHYWPFSVDQIFHQHKHLNIDEQIFWHICDITVWKRKWLPKRHRTTGEWYGYASGRKIAGFVGLKYRWICYRLKFLQEIGLIKAAGKTTDRRYTPVFYDAIRTSFLEDRRWTRKPKPALDPAPDPEIASSEEIHSAFVEARRIIQDKIRSDSDLRLSVLPRADENYFRTRPGALPGACLDSS